ncbi:sulfate transporter CysZ [Candidatus Methylobacter oryzae]|uniref:Sulfate transporter CysZ n=1 Tax=Candidatus Methylobacter oryzae TaxID=2497749 RepID=A0ABY3C988_9GAMM|nr:sulfate transporter CysZ [Candidatus Methylobacter oryzae]TRW92879.1 sulfate transporter CysZ [Candidatus Methylobacter oryzae]
MQFDKKGNNPVLAVSFLFKGLKLLSSPELRKFVIIPMLINVVLYSAALTLGYFYIADLIDQFIPNWLHWLSWILWPLIFISFFIVIFFTFTVMANLLAAPFYGKLSAKTMAMVSDKAFATAEQPLIKVLFAESKRMVYLLTRALPLLLLSIMPGINVLAPFLWALFGAWGMALEYLAYPLENQGVLFAEQKELVKSVKLGALSFGGLAVLGLTIPVLNVIIAPAAVIGATLYFNEIKRD